MKRTGLYFAYSMALSALAVGALVAQAGEPVLPKAKPGAVGLGAERLERIGSAMEADVTAGRVPGAVALVARRGKVAYFEARGAADRETGAPMRPDTIFRIYSMSKPITSVALMILYEEGKFMLQDPVSKYLPELGKLSVLIDDPLKDEGPVFNIPDLDEDSAPAPTVDTSNLKTEPARRDMTVQDLMRHTSGLTYGFFGNSTVDRLYMEAGILTRDADLADMVSKLGKIPLKHQPGTTWEYSVSVDVQGRLVEVLSGTPFDQYLDERIFKPLGMVDTGFYMPPEKMHRFAQMYSPDRNGGIVPADPNLSRNFVEKPGLFSGGGGLVSTAADYYRFCQMLLNGGELNGARILSRKTIELMTANHLVDGIIGGPSGGYGFGLGFAVAEDLGAIGSATSVGEYNWGGAAGTRFWIDPAEEFIGIYMVQILPHTGLNYGSQFKILAYQSITD